MNLVTALLSLGRSPASVETCPSYADFSKQLHPPYSPGAYNLSYMRPVPACRTFNSSDVEDTIVRMKDAIFDKDLYRLFENAFPNTLDTAVKWHGHVDASDEELTFLITGDINAMWLRDSANQMQSYRSLLKPSTSKNSLASLFRGTINLQSRYLRSAPFCNAFNPPRESSIDFFPSYAAQNDRVTPDFDVTVVYECKYEIDSLAAFLEVSYDYYSATKDAAFFTKYSWVKTVELIMDTAEAMMTPTYAANGTRLASPYTWQRQTRKASETTTNWGAGNPVQRDTGLVRSTFRPSDDSTIFQLFIPGNMMFSRYLGACVEIARAAGGLDDLAERMSDMAAGIREAILKHGIVDSKYGKIFAYEVDGYGGAHIMDDANIPSLLAAPFYGFVNASDPVYQNTRRLALSTDNPYFAHGPVLSAIGGPHNGPGKGWPMSSIVRILTSDNDAEIASVLRDVLASTDRHGLVHESQNAWKQWDWSRQWFSWANGLFGQMILDLHLRKPHILKQSFQPTTPVGTEAA